MFEQLNNFLDAPPHRHRFISISESSSNLTCHPSIFIHHFLYHYLKKIDQSEGGDRKMEQSDCGVIFIGLAQPFLHYKAMCQKRSLNLSKCRERGSLVFVEGMKEVMSKVVDDDDDNDSEDAFSFIGRLFKDDDDETCHTLFPLYMKVKSHLDKLMMTANVLIVVDDLTLLLDIGVSLRSVMAFTHQLYSLCVDAPPAHHTTLLTSTRSTPSSQLHTDDIDDDCLALASLVSHQSDVRLRVEALKTGCSKDVHGQLLVENTKEAKKLHFRVEDRSVQFFPIGKSSAVL